MDSDHIAVPEMIGAIERSGYLLEQRVSAILRRHSYYAQTNPAYPDPETGKSREYDVSAISGVRLSKKRMDFLFPVLLVECENNQQPVVFFSAESRVSFLHHQEVRCSGLPVRFWDGRRFISFSRFLGMEKFHHYCKGPVATQYCSFHRKNTSSSWIALHDEGHHQTFSSLINALESSIEEHYEGWVLPDRGVEEPLNIQVYYPVLVLQGPIYRAETRRRKLVVESCEHVQFRKQVWSSRRNNEYQIDVITERYLPRFLAVVDREVDAIKRRLQRHRGPVRDSIQRLIARARRLRRRKASWREAFDPEDSGRNVSEK